ncbi:hypothetical protein QTP88_012478 [Uroleucon formosanum]
MDSLEIPAKLTRLIKSCVYNSKSKISFEGELSEEFQVTTGLRQGDALSPALFNIALELVMRTVISLAKGIEIKDNQHLTAVAYADDIVLLAETVDDLKNTTDILLKEGKKIGLKINETKTKYMIVSRQNHRSVSLKANEYTFERVGNFKYLGADINEDANSHKEVKRRLIAANRCYYGLLPLFKSKLLSRKSKVTLYKVLVRPIALYASSTWATTKSDEKKLEVFERKILRKIFGPKKNNEGEYEERIEILNKSISEKIDFEKIEKEAGLSNLSPEISQTNTEITDKPLYTDRDSLELFDNLNNGVNLFSNKIQGILNSSEKKFSESQKETNDLISLDTSNNLENTTVFEGYKPDVNNKNNISNNQSSYTHNTPNMFNQGSGNKYMVIKPDSFSGKGILSFFCKQYEKAAEVNNWDDKEKIKFLSICLKDTANTFLENLENIKKDWTWKNLKNEFLNEFQPIGYFILLKNKLENRRQERKFV